MSGAICRLATSLVHLYQYGLRSIIVQDSTDGFAPLTGQLMPILSPKGRNSNCTFNKLWEHVPLHSQFPIFLVKSSNSYQRNPKCEAAHPIPPPQIKEAVPCKEHSSPCSNERISNFIFCIFSCYLCRQRKTKCDRILPRCGFCIKAKVECQYVSKPKKRGLRAGYVSQLESRIGK